MITVNGYSKDPNIIPEGIAITIGKELIEEQGGLLRFLRHFNKYMDMENGYWMHKMKNKPQHAVSEVYIILHGRVYCKGFFVSWQKFDTIGATPDGEKIIDWPGIIVAGPITKAPLKINRKGFQGFRYTTKLF